MQFERQDIDVEKAKLGKPMLFAKVFSTILRKCRGRMSIFRELDQNYGILIQRFCYKILSNNCFTLNWFDEKDFALHENEFLFSKMTFILLTTKNEY